MATSAPKSIPKIVPTAEQAQPEPAPKKSGKKLFLILALLVILLAGGGAAWYFLAPSGDAAAGAEKKVEVKPPIFVVLDPFTVNLRSEEGLEQFLQVALTLQVAEQPMVDSIKLYMPEVRNRLLLLLSSKTGTDILPPEGKKKLAEEIVATLNKPFSPQGAPQKVTNVFFTSFVVQ